MGRDPRYDILFEPVAIGPLKARNRFFQVPHCTGAGHQYINTQNRIREIRAEGGWAVVCTDICSIHPSSDVSPYAFLKLWDDADVKALAAMADAVHEHGALVGCQLMHEGVSAMNRMSREVAIGPSPRPHRVDPRQTRAMSLSDIRDVRKWQHEAAIRARQAGFDLVYVYAAHGLSLAMDFLSRRINQRSDEYGGTLENRSRLLREMIEVTKDAVGDRCAVAVRIAVDELIGSDGITCEEEGRDVIEMLAELPDLWDVNISDHTKDSPTSRFCSEGHQEPYIRFVKQVTSKPVVGVGWFTSPDTMVSQIRRGVLDFIGAARPGIADPFIPQKISEGRIDDIRECIGCNICLAGEYTIAPMRCTQNPTMGEEWRRGWHPERIAPKASESSVLVVGAGPAGLEAARALGQRGYAVTLAEASRQLGGRINHESRLPGMAPYARVRDWRISQINAMPNVACYLESRLTPDDILELGADQVILATGSRWLKTGVGRMNFSPVPADASVEIISPDDIFAGWEGEGPVVIFDDDGYYMASTIALLLASRGVRVVLATPQGRAASWMAFTGELFAMNEALLAAGVAIIVNRNLTAIKDGRAELSCVFSGAIEAVPAASVLMVTMREGCTELYDALLKIPDRMAAAGIAAIRQIGDCAAPSIVADAVHSGHRCARELDMPDRGTLPFAVEHTALAEGIRG
ncbi:MAG: NAD(P)-binding protein [Rhizobiales bacterium]|nr:NAD(P)-binding protein [Hyphomicrobiales bacterium]